MSKDLLRLSDLRPGLLLRGLLPNDVVTVVSVTVLAEDIVDLVYRPSSGGISECTLEAGDLDGISVVADEDSGPDFNGQAMDFRLAAEALRIKYAALYDPIAAVNSSDVDPLPHQIRAVYEELLPRIPLRFLLADDPGAGKTIMAGLYIKELILRSDCERAIIVAPGGLVEQWRDELAQKFDVHFEVFNPPSTAQLSNNGSNTLDSNLFAESPYLIVRMDQVCRSEALMEQLSAVTWDVAIVDEAHRMTARYSTWMGEVDKTKRFSLGSLLSETAHNFLLMTATPHAGKEEDFQLFMSLLDKDRFEGQFREGVHRTDTQGLMRRMVKEDLLTFEGKPLFPERRAYTVAYDLSQGERQLYEAVSDYVRTEMGRADRISEEGDRKRGNNVGFALTVLQRRLASSPEAILRSLERRQRRLEDQLERVRQFPQYSNCISDAVGDVTDLLVAEDELGFEHPILFEQRVDEVVGLATAAQTTEELQYEISVLAHLISVAREVRNKGEDRKWVELRNILNEQLLSRDSSGQPRKIIIFTEHRDTLNYLEDRIRTQFGRAGAVLTIHGGTSRDERFLVREKFTHDPEAVVLLATDAAGEGMNLQRAHLMVNYDLPWNPNRIEQRFGRVHRIGQREVCHLWNLVAHDTREGAVFTRLLSKISNMDRAYNGNLFNVLGEHGAFQEKSLKDLLIDAIRYGDRPETQAKLNNIIDAGVSEGLNNMIAERALHPEMFNTLDLEAVRQRMEQARERKLQPGFISAFFIPAFERLGGSVRRREQGRYEVTRVPHRVMEQMRKLRGVAPPSARYERITFETQFIHRHGRADAALIAPGHPLLHAVIDLTIADLGSVLSAGTVFIDRSDNQLDSPSLMYTVEQRVRASVSGHTVSHHFAYLLLSQDGEVSVTPAPLYLDYEQPRDDELQAISQILDTDWVRQNHEKIIREWAYREGMRPRLEELKIHRRAEIERTRTQVRERLRAEINHWDSEYNRLFALEREGNIGRIRAETAKVNAEGLEFRLDKRMRELDDALRISPAPTKICGVALVVPSALISQEVARCAKDTKAVERRAVDAVLAAERRLGRIPTEMPHNNPGFDVRSTDADGTVYIEVKGRIVGANSFTVTVTEVNFAQSHRDSHILALVRVHPDGPEYDQVRYITQAFDHIESSITTQAYDEKWSAYWDRGRPPS